MTTITLLFKKKIILSILIVSVLQSGCSVAPWERGNLAKKQMLITPNPGQAALRLHVFDSKESSQGGIGAARGGCGCN
jgi:PBP1b-binding outer membrane lipoprotein LpoB